MTLTREQIEKFREFLKRIVRRDTIIHVPVSDELAAVEDLIDFAIAGYKSQSPTHRHVKRGTDYVKIGEAQVQSSFPIKEEGKLVIYRDAEGQLWARPRSEFEDGRFVEIREKP